MQLWSCWPQLLDANKNSIVKTRLSRKVLGCLLKWSVAFYWWIWPRFLRGIKPTCPCKSGGDGVDATGERIEASAVLDLETCEARNENRYDKLESQLCNRVKRASHTPPVNSGLTLTHITKFNVNTIREKFQSSSSRPPPPARPGPAPSAAPPPPTTPRFPAPSTAARTPNFFLPRRLAAAAVRCRDGAQTIAEGLNFAMPMTAVVTVLYFKNT